MFLDIGGASIDSGFVFGTIDQPTEFTASDLDWTPPLSVAVGAGDTFGLALVSYAIAPDARGGTVPITFVDKGTSLSDADGLPITVTSEGGSIVVQGSQTIPEPSTMAMMAIALISTLAGRVVGGSLPKKPAHVAVSSERLTVSSGNSTGV